MKCDPTKTMKTLATNLEKATQIITIGHMNGKHSRFVYRGTQMELAKIH